jgi:hypothetical protein
MPSIGFEYGKWAPITSEPDNALPVYGTGKSLGGAVSGSHTPNFAETPHYSDNILKNQISKFTSGALALTVDDVNLQTHAEIFGATFADDQVNHKASDKAPFGGISWVETILTEDNEEIYRGFFYPKVKAVRTAKNFNTQQENIELGLTDINFTTFAAKSGDYEIIKDFSDIASARSWVDSNINDGGTFYTVKVAKSGDADVSPLGTYIVAAGEDFEITIPTGVDALYDNGADVSASVVSNKYTISSLAASHEVVAVYNAE